MYGPINGTFENSSFYYLSCYFLLHRFWALQIPPPLTKISSSRFVRKGMRKDWFVIQLSVSNWFQNQDFFLKDMGIYMYSHPMCKKMSLKHG
jgi:hypothetical protein